MIWEPEFLLGYYAGITPKEAYFMPVAKKRWYMERINKELTKTSDAGQTQSRALQHNTPDVRAVTGMQRQQVPSRLRRFT